MSENTIFPHYSFLSVHLFTLLFCWASVILFVINRMLWLPLYSYLVGLTAPSYIVAITSVYKVSTLIILPRRLPYFFVELSLAGTFENIFLVFRLKIKMFIIFWQLCKFCLPIWKTMLCEQKLRIFFFLGAFPIITTYPLLSIVQVDQ